MVVGFRVALDSVNNGRLVRAAAHILCGTVRVKQVDRIRAAFNVTHFESMITHLLYTAINTTEHTVKEVSVLDSQKKLHTFNTTSWRCSP